MTGFRGVGGKLLRRGRENATESDYGGFWGLSAGKEGRRGAERGGWEKISI